MKGNLFKEFGTYSQFITQSHFEIIHDFVKFADKAVNNLPV